MCLTTTDTTIKIAKKDIVCFKAGETDGDTFTSFYRDYDYERMKRQPNVDLEFSLDEDAHPVVHKGYHSYNVKKDVGKIEPRYPSIFIIPKGTRYIDGYFNGEGIKNRVSSSIIFYGRDTWWNRLKIRIKYGRNALKCQ